MQNMGKNKYKGISADTTDLLKDTLRTRFDCLWKTQQASRKNSEI